jgi:hypothetical protein
MAVRPGLVCHYRQNAPPWLCSDCHSAHDSVRITLISFTVVWMVPTARERKVSGASETSFLQGQA